MPSTPTTKSQVQAYQFVLRRMQSALVRRDAVMLNDPMRTHSRATIVGVVLGALGMLGFVIWGLISPQPAVPDAGNIVIGEQSGTVYVVVGNPKKLIPTFNLASARLILMAQQQGQQNAQGGAQTAAPAAGGSPSVVNATVVSDEQLKDIPRGKLTGIPDGPQLLPTDNQRISANWAVCDEIGLDTSLNDPTDINQNTTTVLAGVPNLGRELGNNEALLANADNGKTYLIYRLPRNQNQSNADNVVRAEVDLTTNAVTSALDLPSKRRQISNGLLNAIREVPRLTPPSIDDKGSQPSTNLDGLLVGDVFSTSQAEGKVFWAITKTGIQKITPSVANMIVIAKSGSGGTIQSLSFNKTQNIKHIEPGDADYLPIDDYPGAVPTVLEAVTNPVSCLGWSVTGEGNAQQPHTSLFVGGQMPGPNTEAIPVGTPSPDGGKIDKFYMQPGFAAVVQSVTSKESIGKGPIQLISDRGLRYGVPDARTADGLGLGNRQPAPESIISLLPTGASLNTQDVLKSFDSVPIDPKAGAFPSAQGNAAAPPGN
jgi:type VII secretion protein EccB